MVLFWHIALRWPVLSNEHKARVVPRVLWTILRTAWVRNQVSTDKVCLHWLGEKYEAVAGRSCGIVCRWFPSIPNRLFVRLLPVPLYSLPSLLRKIACYSRLEMDRFLRRHLRAADNDINIFYTYACNCSWSHNISPDAILFHIRQSDTIYMPDF